MVRVIDEVLDAAKLANNKLPDIFLDLTITSKELKILQQIWSHATHPHSAINFSRHYNGAIKKLRELGVVKDNELDPQYFLRLGVQFRPDLDKNSTAYVTHLVRDICRCLYDHITVTMIDAAVHHILQLENIPCNPMDARLKEIKLRKQIFCSPECYKVTLNDGSIIYVPKSAYRVAISICRVPISVVRVPLHPHKSTKNRSKMMLQEIRNKLGILTKHEQNIMNVVHYYEYKCRVATGNSGWRAVSRNFREHRNWVHFTRIYELCKKEGWDYKVYIDSQFDRVKFWIQRSNQKYPYPNQCYSTNAIKYFHNYCKDYKARYSATGDAKIKTSKVQSYQREVIDAIIKDCERFVDFFKVAPKQRKYNGLTPEQMKFMYVVDHVASLSHYYWASLPWAVDFLCRFTTPWVVELTDTVAKIQKSKSMLQTIKLVVTEVENRLGIPHTVLPNGNT